MVRPRLAALAPPLALASWLGAPALASAGEPTQLDAPGDDRPAIWQGETTSTCAWPSAVAVQSGGGLCTGTLVHPELVVYAAHCGSGTQAIRFGESLNSPNAVAPQFCRTYPSYGGVNDQAHDWAFCKLSSPVEVPVTPTVYGCESQILFPGQQIAIAGFGGNAQGGGGSGIKRWALTTLDGINLAGNVSVTNGGSSASVCPGDSGGPAFVRFPDGGWRAFGIASTVSGGCGGSGTHSLIMGAAEWIESESGIDITPCHDIEGNWDPGPLCGNFYAQEPGVGSSTWGQWCSGEPTIGWAETCGDALPSLDAGPPTVAISAPSHGTEYPTAPATFDIAVDATDDLSYVKVSLVVNGEAVPNSVDDQPPYLYEGVTFPAGQWIITAVAEDAAGNVVSSEPVGVGVGMPAPEIGDGDGDGDGDGGEGDGDDGGNADAGGDVGGDDFGGDDFGAGDGSGDDGGCSVAGRAPNRGLGGLALLMGWIAVAPLRRRRPRDRPV